MNKENYNRKVKSSKLFSERVKEESDSILADLEKLHKETNQEELNIKKEILRKEINELEKILGIIN